MKLYEIVLLLVPAHWTLCSTPIAGRSCCAGVADAGRIREKKLRIISHLLLGKIDESASCVKTILLFITPSYASMLIFFSCFLRSRGRASSEDIVPRVRFG